MKVFISYGHNDYVSLVNRLFDALSEEGIEPWKDDRYKGQSGIKPGDEFIKVIQKAILDSDYVVAFVTKATTQKNFCCDERVYAYNHKGTRFIQIRLDKVDILLGNSKSYIDMDDCINPDGTINEKMFAEKLRALFSAFRDPDSFAEGGFTPWAKFEAHLRIPGAVKYEEFTTMPEQDDFVGREWLKKKCISWVQDDTIPYRLFVILGEAGTGKTAFIRHLAKDKALVRSVHICIYDRPSTRKAADTLKDLAYILAKNNNRYFNFLKNLNFEKLREMDIDGLFEFLFIDPLKQETEKYLLIIDGLDELDDIMGFTPLMKIFRQYANKINPNISFLVTGRPDDNITHKLNTVGFEENNQVLLNTQNSSDDLLNFIDIKLNELGCFSENLRSKIFNASDNNFEYLTLLFKEAKEEGLNFSENMKLPHGLNERYTQYMDRRTEQFGQFGMLNDEQSMLLDILSVTYEPVPVSLLAMISKMTERKTKNELKVFGSLIKSEKAEDNEPYISFFSKGFRDFLTGGVCDNYSTDTNEGQALITEYILNNCKCEADFKKYPYIDKHGFIHLFIYASKKKADCSYIFKTA